MYPGMAAAVRDAVQRDRRLQFERSEARTAHQRQLDYAVQQVSDGLVSRATTTLLSKGMAPPTQATADKLAELQFRPSPAAGPHEWEIFLWHSPFVI